MANNHNFKVKNGLDVTGNISVGGTVDGRDLAADGSKLDGVSTGAEANPSASEMLTSIKTVDGSGSGLDADLLDGVHGSSFLRSDATDTMTGTLIVDNDTGIEVIYGTETTNVYYTGYGMDSQRGATYIRPIGGDNTQTLYIGGAGSSDDWNSIELKTGSNTAVNINGNSVFHDAYHPNADKWTTSRTLSLSGDASGSVSWDGSANATLSVTVADDSHAHSRLYEKSTVDYGASYLQWFDVSGSGGSNGNGGTPSNPTSDWYHHIVANHANSGGYYVDIAQSFHSDAVYHRRLENGSLGSWQRFFTDAYHPNADKWTTARTHTVTLTGDVTGSASQSVDGSGNKTWTISTNVGDADTVDGYHGSRFFRRQTKTNATVGGGWMTVASCGSGRHSGEVIVTDADSGDHAYVRIAWMRSFADSNFTVINTGGHANRITGARVLYQTADNTYGTKLLQVYVTTSSNYEVNVYELGDIADFGVPTAVTPVIENSKTGYALHGSELLNLDTYGLSAEEGIQAASWIRAGSGFKVGTNDVWHAGNDGSGSGLDADLLDGYHASSFHINSYDNDVTADAAYVDNWFRAKGDTGLYFEDKGTGIRSPLSEGGQYGSVATYGNELGWDGFSLGGRVVFMHDLSNSWGIYNDVNNEWMIYGLLNNYVELRYDNNTRFRTNLYGNVFFGYEANMSDNVIRVRYGSSYVSTTSFGFSGVNSNYGNFVTCNLTGNSSIDCGLSNGMFYIVNILPTSYTMTWNNVSSWLNNGGSPPALSSSEHTLVAIMNFRGDGNNWRNYAVVVKGN